MSGRRRKALKRAFIAEHGRPPEGATLYYGVKKQNELRPLKKAYARGHRP